MKRIFRSLSIGLGLLLIVVSSELRAQPSQQPLRYYVEQAERSDFRSAIEKWEQALEIARVSGDRKTEWYALSSLGLAKEMRGDNAGAIAYYEQAIKLAREFPDRVGEGLSLSARAGVKLTSDDYTGAFADYEQAIEILHEYGKRKEEADALVGRGNVKERIADSTGAMADYEQALRISRETNYRDGETHALRNIGIVKHRIADYAGAIADYEHALRLAGQEPPNRQEEGYALNNLGNVKSDLGDYAGAIANYEHALKIAHDIGARKDEAALLNNLGVVKENLGDYAGAIVYSQQALTVLRDMGNPRGIATAQANIAEIFLALGRFAEALPIVQQGGDPVRLGIYYVRTGDYEAARASLEQSLPDFKQPGFATHLLGSYIGLGLSEEHLQQYSTARVHYQMAVELIEHQREGLNEGQRRHFYMAKVLSFPRLEAYEGLARVNARLGKQADALYWSEHTKGRLLLEALAKRSVNSRLGLPEALAKEEAELANRLASTYKQIDLAFEKNNSERQRELEQQLPELKQAQQVLVSRLRKDYPAYAAVRYPQPLRVQELKLKANEALIEYEVTDSVTLAWLVKDGKIVKTLTIPITRKDLAQQITRYRRFFEAKHNLAQLADFDPKLGLALYQRLFKGFAALLKPEDELIIVPDEILAVLPFEALVVEMPAKPKMVPGKFGPVPEGVRYLGDVYGIRYAQSASALMQAAARAHPTKGNSLLVVADPVFDLTDARAQGQKTLLASRDEYRLNLMRAVEEYRTETKATGVTFPRLNIIGGLPQRLTALYPLGQVDTLTGFAASEAQLKERLARGYRYLVIATHGILDNEIPYIKEPALVLALVDTPPGLAAKPAATAEPGTWEKLLKLMGLGSKEASPVAPTPLRQRAKDEPSSGFLTMTKVMEIELDSDLVALIACNTGIGKQQSGEGVMGMGRAFQYAGVKSVLMSLWSVEEESTNLLTEKLFTYLKQGKDKLSALRQARADVRLAGYEHPYFWAPFILVGEGR